jgi:hypothetical protein
MDAFSRKANESRQPATGARLPCFPCVIGPAWLRSALGCNLGMKRALLILASFGYVMFLIAGTDTGLGVYRTPAWCFAAVVCAGVAVAYVTAGAKWYWSIAGAAALVLSFYGYHQNDQWREKLSRVQAQHPAPATQTNK